ncbi:EAL domain-containing protein [Vibrio sp. SCSIO 43137]|uniref:EAL domain-containing protein n=1 Tax=Vibrio sp. SCSIO 43137 TaxID=3021011 RepID=UPI00230806A0|nr:EAL domain-containing protein [Vibrio sp. SCSIO 43137]WCE31015.1 EAL domain-containing protein [Vibrio sp. SCSIO 43137]
MKIIIIETEQLTRQLIQNCIGTQAYSLSSFSSVYEALDYVRQQTSPFILLSEIISSRDFDLANMYMILQMKNFRGILFLSQYSDDIISTAKLIANDLGFNNIDGLTLPAENQAIRNKISKIVELDKIVCMTPDYREPLSRNHILAALDNDSYEPFFQAQVSSDSRQVTGFELLARLSCNGMIYLPSEFIGVLVQAEKISDFTCKLLKKSLRLLRVVDAFDGNLSVNVDYQSLSEQDFAGRLLDIVRRFNFPVERLTIEITENSPVINIFVMHNLNEFRIAGCSLSIDDFGTQNSGFTELLKLPFSELKIDRSFVCDLKDSSRAYKVVKALVAVADSLDCRVVAEGVETEHQADMLRELGVGFQQGYLYSKPQPIVDISNQALSEPLKVLN